jgi:TrkA family protein/RyR domain-containing protein
MSPSRHSDHARPRLGRQLRRLWRGRVSRQWRAVRPVVLIALGVSVLVLGTIGFEQYKELDNGRLLAPYGFLDSLYRAITLFGLGGAVPPPVPLTLQIARIVAPILTGYAAVGLIITLSREQARVLAIRLFVRHHVVIAGLGATGSRLALSLVDNEPVVVIELAPSSPHDEAARARGVRILPGSATDEIVLRRAGIHHARALVVTCGSDGANVDAAAAAARALSRSHHPITVFVHLNDVDLWSTLAAEGATFGSPPAGMRLEYFNILETGAQLMVERNPPFDSGLGNGKPYQPHILLVGIEGVGEPLVLYIVRTWRSLARGPADQLRITLTGASAAQDVARLRQNYPALDAYCELQARPLPIESASFQAGGAMVGADDRCDVTRAYVCIKDEADALIAALALHSRPDTVDVPVSVALPDADSGVAIALGADRGRFGAIKPFGALSEAASSRLLLKGMNELFARAQHAQWLRTQQAKSVSAERKPAMRTWEELDETEREVNRRFADDIQNKLSLVGYMLVPMPLPDPNEPAFAFSSEEVELLAKEEHERWMADKLAEGWRYGPKRDNARRIHDQIKPWEELDEENRDLDRDAVRELPSVIELAGFKLQRVAHGARA